MTAPRARRSRATIDERAFHRWLRSHLPAGRTGRLPLGDDAADLTPPRGRVAIVTTDSIIEGTHFLARSPAGRVGAAATNVSLSDLASKGARPAGVLLALHLPPGTPAGWARAVVRGAERAAVLGGAHVVGGDTKPSPVRAVVSTAIGWAHPRRLPPRHGARPSDLVVVTGVVGRGGVAMATVRREGITPRSLAGLLEVHPRIAAGEGLARLAHAMLDTSDGVAEASRLLAAASRVRVVLDEDRLPLVPALRRAPPARRRSLAFFGGDYELLAAIPRAAAPRLGPTSIRTGTPLTVVGHVEQGRGAFLETREGRLRMPATGWRPFARPDRAAARRAPGSMAVESHAPP
jgi:thiamine-monophosphate kinase